MLEADILPPAGDDFDESYAWYAKQSLPAAERFAVAIDGAIERLRLDPKIGIRIDSDH
jgi:plasmid stabilization system protein ParE